MQDLEHTVLSGFVVEEEARKDLLSVDDEKSMETKKILKSSLRESFDYQAVKVVN